MRNFTVVLFSPKNTPITSSISLPITRGEVEVDADAVLGILKQSLQFLVDVEFVLFDSRFE